MLKVKLITHTPNPEEVVASAAKLCYSKVGVDEILEKLDTENTEDFIQRLAKINHYSPFEHVTFTFAIEGVSRALTHQLVRHRIASYSQQSQRYVRESEFEFITPPSIASLPNGAQLYKAHMEQTQAAYDMLIRELMLDKIFKSDNYEAWYNAINEVEELNIAELFKNLLGKCSDPHKKDVYISKYKELFLKDYLKLEKETIEDARYIFPNATETKIVVTMNARTLLHFFQLRCCNRAQWEIRELADNMLTLVHQAAPGLFSRAGAPCTFGKCDQGEMTCGKPRKLEDILIPLL